MIDIYKLDDFTEAYIECSLWSSMDYSDDSGGNPLDDNYCISDISEETLQSMIVDCKDFQESNKQLLEDAIDYLIGYNMSQAGHDFWLTRNGHGAGFWDRGLDEIGRKLTEASKVYSEVNLYIGNDNKIYSI